jgi:hypothetical protein
MVSCNFATHVTCLLELTVYKYSELKVFVATQKLSYKANCKTPFFFIVHVLQNFWFEFKLKKQLFLSPNNFSFKNFQIIFTKTLYQ